MLKTVPVDLTPEMLEAGAVARSMDYAEGYCDEDDREEVHGWVKAMWKAILDAAPEPNE